MISPAETCLPECVRARLDRDGLKTSLRLLTAGGRVDEGVWLRRGVAGRVVAPNGRVSTALLAFDAADGLLSATCPCTPKQRPYALCPHLGALAAALSRPDATGSARLPGDHFADSPWLRAVEGLVERFPSGLRSTALQASSDGPSAGLRIETADGLALASLFGSGEPWAGLAKSLPSGPVPAGAFSRLRHETLLALLVRTSEEITLNEHGVKSRRQAAEESILFVLAARAFDATAKKECTARIETDAAGAWLVAFSDGGELRLRLEASALEALARRDGGVALAALGLSRVEGSVQATLRLSIDARGDLLLSPALVVTTPGGTRTFDLPEARTRRCGGFALLPEAGGLVGVEERRRPFREPEAGAQGSLGFDDEWSPSAVGVPVDVQTRIPSAAVARFLSRHRDELAAWPVELLPPELGGGGLAEPEGAELVALGEESGRYLLEVVYRVRGQAVPFGTILAARKKKETLVAAAGGLLDPQHARYGWMDGLEKSALSGRGAKVRLHLSPLDVCRVRSYLPANHQVTGAGASAAALARLEDLAADAPAPPPEELGLPLFDFQRTGYSWLWFLYRNGFGGLLCDDMGLGKTWQAVALLAAMARESGHPPRVLVVCPASVLPHWDEILRRLVPGLPVRRHHGAARGVAEAGERVLLTTYGTLRNDAVALAGTPFDLFILDEVQTVKNRGTATHQALREIQAGTVIGLTGTPVENSVEELRTLLDFVLPGYLPGEAEFRKGFAKPIEEGDAGALERLRRLVRPFLLRRTKSQVALGLPEKLHDRRECEMTPGQAELYRTFLEQRGGPLRAALEGPGPVPYLHVFALLTKLKQLCDHPDLLRPEGDPPGEEGSGKWDLLVELLDEALGSGLKVVVFSQYLRMLDKMGAHLTGLGVDFETLRGATVDRAAPVARFRKDPSCRVFLASLRAAGVGIDLTAASVVVHYDRWWNAAREEQATDRVHRIGQTRGVQVVTLVTRGTVEERIDRLIADKARLAKDLVPEEDPRLLRRFTREELRGLLEE